MKRKIKRIVPVVLSLVIMCVTILTPYETARATGLEPAFYFTYWDLLYSLGIGAGYEYKTEVDTSSPLYQAVDSAVDMGRELWSEWLAYFAEQNYFLPGRISESDQARIDSMFSEYHKNLAKREEIVSSESMTNLQKQAAINNLTESNEMIVSKLLEIPGVDSEWISKMKALPEEAAKTGEIILPQEGWEKVRHTSQALTQRIPIQVERELSLEEKAALDSYHYDNGYHAGYTYTKKIVFTKSSSYECLMNYSGRVVDFVRHRSDGLVEHNIGIVSPEALSGYRNGSLSSYSFKAKNGLYYWGVVTGSYTGINSKGLDFGNVFGIDETVDVTNVSYDLQAFVNSLSATICDPKYEDVEVLPGTDVIDMGCPAEIPDVKPLEKNPAIPDEWRVIPGGGNDPDGEDDDDPQRLPGWIAPVPEIPVDPGGDEEKDPDKDPDKEKDPNQDPEKDPEKGIEPGSNTVQELDDLTQSIEDELINPSAPGDIPDISDLFPFCIPKDIIGVLKGFQSKAEAPVFHFQYYFKQIDYLFEVRVDMSIFDKYVGLFRVGILISYIIGLCYLTISISKIFS